MTTAVLEKAPLKAAQAADQVDTLDTSGLAPWVQDLYTDVIMPRRRAAAEHPFTQAIQAGQVEKSALVAFFQGMYWHVTRAGHLFGGFFARRPADVETFLAGRAEDGHSPEEETRLQKTSLGALITALGGDLAAFEAGLADYTPPQEWFLHETQLRSAIFSADFPWQIGAAAINAGTEGIVPWMCGPLADALEEGYGVSGLALEWLHQRITPEEIEHGDNGFLILSHFVDSADADLVANCGLYADKLSLSMSQGLLNGGPASAPDSGRKMSVPETEEINPFAVRFLDATTLRLFRTHPGDATVRLTIEGDRSWREVRIARAFPFSDPDRYIGLRDGDDKDIGILTTLNGLDGESRAIIQEELERRYFTPRIERVLTVKEEFGVVTWEVETDRGPRRFLVRNLRDSTFPLGANRLMMTDTDGNRYEFADVSAVGAKAMTVLSKVL